MSLFRFLSEIISMHRRAEPVNTLYKLFCGHWSSSVFSLSLQISFSWLFSLTQNHSVNSVVLPKSRMLPKSPASNRIFLDDLQIVFDSLVDVTEPICQAIDSAKADMTIFDSSGIEAFVTENNPKYANRIIKQLKAYAKAQGFDKSYTFSLVLSDTREISLSIYSF